MAGQVWIAIDENGLAGLLKGMVVWSGGLYFSIVTTLPGRNRVAAEAAQKRNPGTDTATA